MLNACKSVQNFIIQATNFDVIFLRSFITSQVFHLYLIYYYSNRQKLLWQNYVLNIFIFFKLNLNTWTLNCIFLFLLHKTMQGNACEKNLLQSSLTLQLISACNTQEWNFWDGIFYRFPLIFWPPLVKVLRLLYFKFKNSLDALWSPAERCT